MTTSAQSTFEFDIAKVVRMAYQVAGLMNESQPMSGDAWTAKLAMAMDFLESDLKALQASNLFVRPMDFYDLTVEAGTAQYTMPAETLDLIGDAMWLGDGSDYELPVKPIQRDQWMRYANKDAEGQPTSYYSDRQSTLSVYLYPTPADAGRLRFQRHRLLANVRNGANTLDVERHWTEYLFCKLGKWLAFNASLDQKAGLLDKQADKAYLAASQYSKQRGSQQLYVGHRTGWNR